MVERKRLKKSHIRVLELMNRAYCNDVPVRIGPETTYSDTKPIVSHAAARTLVSNGLAAYARPDERFLLLTNAGWAVLDVCEAA